MTAEESERVRPIVVARVRPRWPKETDARLPVLVRVKSEADGTDSVEIEPGPDGGMDRGPRAVQVTHALGGEATQEDVWGLFSGYLTDFLNRINLSIFAYGETGSGKTYTMSYVTRRFLAELLSRRADYDRFEVSISMVEIDNEKIYCLLSEERRPLSIMNYHVKGARRAVVTTEEECDTVLTECWKRRKTAATDFNDVSSRSHAVCTIKLDATQAGIAFTSEAHICDLAGSERSGLSAQDGNPNVSLSLMSMIVKDIVSGCPRNNFRQSKLTHLLQPALTGRCKLGLVFTLNPCSSRGATSSVQFAKNMMKMPDAKIVRNPMTMTEAQLLAASEQLMAKEAAVRVQLQSAEERQRVVEEENELLRRQLRETHAENVTVIEENRKLAAVLAAEQRQSGIQQEEDQVAIRRLIAAFTSRSEAVNSVVQGVLAPWETVLKEAVAEDVRALADMLSHLLQRLQSVETGYAKTDHARLTMLLPVVAKEMSSLLANDEELLELTSLVNAERGVQDGSEDDELRHALEALMPVAREMVTTLEAAAVHASEMVAKQRRAEALEAEIQRLQEENHQLRTRPLTDTLAPRPPAPSAASSPTARIERRPSLQASLYDKALRQHIHAIPARHAYEKLSHMCALNKFCAARFLKLGGIDTLVSEGLLGAGPDSAEAACTAEFIPAFCILHDARDRVRALGGCEALVAMLSVAGGTEADEVRIKAAGAVAELCRGNSANREYFSDAAMASLVSLMSSDSQHLQEATIVALAEMAEGSESCKQAAAAHGVVGVLLMATMVPNQRVKVAAARALGRLVAGSGGLQREVVCLELEAPDFGWRAINGLTCLAAGLREAHLALQVCTAQALLNCVDGSPEAMELLFAADTLDLLGMDEAVMRSRLLLAVAARVCGAATLLPHELDAGVQTVASKLGAAFPHFSLVTAGCWKDGAWGGCDPSHHTHFLNPQYLVRLESSSDLSIHLEAESPVQGGQSVGLGVYAVDDDGRWEVAFGDRCPAFAVADRDRASACLHLPPGCYAVVPTLHEKEAGLAVNFRIAFAAQQEVEVEALSRLEGWNRDCSGSVAEGSWRGFWKGGDQEGSPFFWRNPQLVLHRGAELSSRSTGSISSSGSLEALLNLPNTNRVLVAVHRRKIKGEGGTRAGGGGQESSVGLSVSPAVPAPGGGFKRSVGANPVLLGEGYALANRMDSSECSSACRALTLGATHSVFEVELPEDGCSGLVLAPFLTNCSADAEFTLNCFTALPCGVEVMTYTEAQEWGRFYTAKLRWTAERNLSIALELPSTARIRGPLAIRFPGARSDTTIDVLWKESDIAGLKGNAGSRVPTQLRSDVARGVPLIGSCLMFSAAPGRAYEVHLQQRGGDSAGKALMMQVFSDVELDAGNLLKDARIEVVAAHLPCPVSVVDDPSGAPIGVDSTDVDAYAGGRTKTDLTTWGIQAARSRETAKHVKSMVAELKAQVEIMRQTHGARQSQSANGSRPAQASLSTDFCRRPTAPQASEFAGLPAPCHRGNSTSGEKLHNASNGYSKAPYSRTGFTSDCGSAKDNNWVSESNVSSNRRTQSSRGGRPSHSDPPRRAPLPTDDVHKARSPVVDTPHDRPPRGAALPPQPSHQSPHKASAAPQVSPRGTVIFRTGGENDPKASAAPQVSPRGTVTFRTGGENDVPSSRISSGVASPNNKDLHVALTPWEQAAQTRDRQQQPNPRRSLEFMAQVLRRSAERPRVRATSEAGSLEARSTGHSSAPSTPRGSFDRRGSATGVVESSGERGEYAASVLGAMATERDAAVAENERLKARLAELETPVVRNPFTGDQLHLPSVTPS